MEEQGASGVRDHALKIHNTMKRIACMFTRFVRDSCMPTKTITLELDAYEKLKAAKRGRESFSSVVRRCILPEGPKTGAALLDYLRARSTFLTEEELDAIESIDRNDSPPVSPWEEEA